MYVIDSMAVIHSSIVTSDLLFWLYGHVIKARRTTLSVKDLGESTEKSEDTYKVFEYAWKRRSEERYHLARTLLRAFPWEFLNPLVKCMTTALLKLASPLLLKATLGFFRSFQSDSPQPSAYGWALCASYFIIYLCLAIMEINFRRPSSGA